MGEERDVYRGLMGKPEGKDRLEDLSVNGMVLQETGTDVVDWIELDQIWDRWRAVVSTAMNL